MFPDCKLHCKAMVIKIAFYWHKNSNVNQWNAKESTEINPCLYDQLIYDKGNKNIQCGRGSLVNNVGKTGQLICKRIKLDYFLKSYTKTNSKGLKN